MKKGTDWIQKNIWWILPAFTAGLFALLLISIMVPKKVIDTYKTNVTEEEGDKEYLIALKKGTQILYEMHTGTRPLRGIHVAVAKNGGAFAAGALTCQVLKKGETEPVSTNRYALKEGEDMQYVYLPFADYEACIGEITIVFTYDSQGNEAKEFPSLLANGRQIKSAKTLVNGTEIEGNLKTIYIYTHNTYPLVYDLRILTVLFFAACMTLPFRKKKKEEAL